MALLVAPDELAQFSGLCFLDCLDWGGQIEYKWQFKARNGGARLESLPWGSGDRRSGIQERAAWSTRTPVSEESFLQ